MKTFIKFKKNLEHKLTVWIVVSPYNEKDMWIGGMSWTILSTFYYFTRKFPVLLSPLYNKQSLRHSSFITSKLRYTILIIRLVRMPGRSGIAGNCTANELARKGILARSRMVWVGSPHVFHHWIPGFRGNFVRAELPSVHALSQIPLLAQDRS